MVPSDSYFRYLNPFLQLQKYIKCTCVFAFGYKASFELRKKGREFLFPLSVPTFNFPQGKKKKEEEAEDPDRVIYAGTVWRWSGIRQFQEQHSREFHTQVAKKYIKKDLWNIERIQMCVTFHHSWKNLRHKKRRFDHSNEFSPNVNVQMVIMGLIASLTPFLKLILISLTCIPNGESVAFPRKEGCPRPSFPQKNSPQ